MSHAPSVPGEVGMMSSVNVETSGEIPYAYAPDVSQLPKAERGYCMLYAYQTTCCKNVSRGGCCQ